MNGGAPNQGRVEVHHEGQWGTVCDDLWDDADATVVCGQLGYDVGTAVGLAHFGRGDGPILLDSVQCEGGEASIEQCPHDPWGEHDCSHAEDAGAICSEYILMMTSWNGNIFRVTGPLWGESTGHRWIPLTNVSCAELWCFLWSASEQSGGQTIDTPVI